MLVMTSGACDACNVCESCQILAPTSDVTLGNWDDATLGDNDGAAWDEMGDDTNAAELTRTDADNLWKGNIASPSPTPVSTDDHLIRFRRESSGASDNMTVKLIEYNGGETTIKTATFSTSATMTDTSVALTSGEAATITDYTKLRMSMEPDTATIRSYGPNGDLSTGNWSDGTFESFLGGDDDGILYDELAGAGNYIWTVLEAADPVNTDSFEVSISSVDDPFRHDQHKLTFVFYRHTLDGTVHGTDVDIELKQGATSIATHSGTLTFAQPTAAAGISMTLTAGEAANITDYSDLSASCTVTGSTGTDLLYRCDYVDFDLPRRMQIDVELLALEVCT